MRDDHFDAGYYRRFYEHPATSIVTTEMKRAEVAFVLAFCRYIELDITRFTDVGAGTGWWAKEFRRQHRHCDDIETLDASRDACERYGHRHSLLQKLSGRAADLVVCRDVLRYLADRDAEEGIRRLARKCRGVLYVHVIAREDEIDVGASDTKGYFRPVSWYRRRFREAGFRDCGMGLLVSRRFTAFTPWKMETL